MYFYKKKNNVNKKGIFQKSNEKHIDQMNELIVELKQNYKELDKNKVYDKIAKELNNNSTLKDVLTLASCFYEYLFVCIRNNNKDMEEQEIEKVIADLKAFLLYPYNTIINNIKILEEKDIMIIISYLAFKNVSSRQTRKGFLKVFYLLNFLFH